jgi:hypothetical protein
VVHIDTVLLLSRVLLVARMLPALSRRFSYDSACSLGQRNGKVVVFLKRVTHDVKVFR